MIHILNHKEYKEYLKDTQEVKDLRRKIQLIKEHQSDIILNIQKPEYCQKSYCDDCPLRYTNDYDFDFNHKRWGICMAGEKLSLSK